MSSYRPNVSIAMLRGLNILRKRFIELIKPGLLKRAIGQDENGVIQYELQPNRKQRRAIAAIVRKRK